MLTIDTSTLVENDLIIVMENAGSSKKNVTAADSIDIIIVADFPAV